MTKIREGYKETEIGVIPEDWEVSKLSQILQNRSEKYTPNEDEDFLYVALEHIDQESGRLIGIGKSSESTSTKSAFYKKDVLFGKLRPYLRKYWLSDIDGVCSTEILALKPLTHPEFAFYTIQSNKFIEDISNKAFGTKMPRTSWADMKDYKIPLPPLPEQKRIAEILSTTDAHIEKLDKIIEDYQLLKKGMMKKLLTEGIGHTEFKETEIGRIPKEWEVVKLSQVADAEKINSFIDGDWIEKEHITDAGIRLIQTGNIGVGYYIEKEEKKFIFERSFNDLNCKEVYPNDILICRMAEPTGRSCIIPNLNSRMITSVDCVILRVNESYYDNHFVNHYINSEESLKYSYQNQQGTTRKRITRKKLGELKIPVPKLEEQLKISSILNEIDQRIELLRTEVKDFKNFKKSMMEQLLTGKIRTIYLQSGGVI